MNKLFKFCLPGKVSPNYRKHINFKGPRETMENPLVSNVDDFQEEKTKSNMNNSQAIFAANLIENHNFSKGLESWHPNSCDASIVSSGDAAGVMAKSGKNYAVITNRKEHWQGLEQDITGKVSLGSTYIVSANVGISGPRHNTADVLATLKLEYLGSDTKYMFIGRTSVRKQKWTKLEGTFKLSTLPNRVVFYLEGPPPGVDLLIESVVISSSNKISNSDMRTDCVADGDENIILNPTFDDSLNNWSGRGCRVVLHDSMADGKIKPLSGKFFAAATGRTQSWNGIQQDISGRVQRKLAYEVTAVVRIFGKSQI